MLESRIDVKNGKPLLFVDGSPVSAMAYTTYFEERSRYADFIKAGYRIFFVNVSFTTAPINSYKTGFTPFNVGVFEDADHPDYSEFEDAVYKIIKECPDAIIFPRIYISMPKWWTQENPDEVVSTNKGGAREILFSEKFRADGSELLLRLIRHIKASDYEARVGGWQICGGQTQEWFHPDMCGCLCHGAEKYYRRWVLETYGEEDAVLPKKEDFEYCGNAFQEKENARRYSLFCNLGVAKTIEHFASVIKDKIGGSQVVGSFYGYTYESNNTVLFGSHGLRCLLDSPYLDFFSSPNAYTLNRAFGIDWADMIPVDSLRKHGKLAFIECDVRTCLTTSIQEARPGRYPDDIYKTKTGVSVWSGPPTLALSREALRKCFAHQVTKASAIWWFDMWGGWYADPFMLDELAEMKTYYDRDLADAVPTVLSPEVAVFADEEGYANLFSNSPHLGSHYNNEGIIATRTALGNVGSSYDSFLVEDAKDVLPRYKAALFPFPIPSEAGKKAMALCDALKIPYLTATPQHTFLTAEEIRAFLKNCGVHLYTEDGDVAYVGNGYVGLHSAVGGRKTLKLPLRVVLQPVFGATVPVQISDTVTFDLQENGTALFSVRPIKE